MVRTVWLAFIALLATLCLGTTGFVLTEHLSLGNALYLTVQTITTVGFGDIRVQSTAGRIFLIILMLGGVGVAFYFAGLLMAFLIEGQLAGVYWRRKMNKQIAQLQDHVIVCGGGRVGRQAVYRLHKEKAPCLVIEQNTDIANQLVKDGYLVIIGDATHDDTLNDAGINKAKGLISALPDDTLNVFITLTAKGLNPNIHVVARMDQPESEKKLLRAGADKVISPSTLGGLRMAMSILRPISIEYLETVIHDQNIAMEMVEIRIRPESVLVGQTLLSSRIKQQTGALVLAILRDSQMISNPVAGEQILSEDLLIAFGLRDQLLSLEKLAVS